MEKMRYNTKSFKKFYGLNKYHHDYWERVGIAINEGQQPEFTAKEMAASQIFNDMKADGMNLLEIREAIQKISADII